jgi:hypothetical protein
MIAHQLPPGWEWNRLGDICEEDKAIVDGRFSDLPFLGLEMVEAETRKIDWDAQTVDEQHRIVTVIDAKLATVEKARKTAEERLAHINTLPAAILRQAFNGDF